MTYQWKFPNFYSVSAQTAGEELDRIYRSRGKLEPADIVNESREEDAPLHDCFEWDDVAAAEKYRENQAREIIRAVVIKDNGHEEMNDIRAFVRVESTYQPMEVVVKSEDKMQELLHSAMRELSAFRKKYSRLSELQPVFSAIDAISA